MELDCSMTWIKEKMVTPFGNFKIIQKQKSVELNLIYYHIQIGEENGYKKVGAKMYSRSTGVREAKMK